MNEVRAHPGQQAMPRDAQQPVQQPARGAPRQQEVGQDRETAAQPRPELDSGEDPVAGREAVLLDVGRLGLEHQAGDVDRRRALGPAELAMDTEIGMSLEFVGTPEPGIDLAGGELADEVGL